MPRPGLVPGTRGVYAITDTEMARQYRDGATLREVAAVAGCSIDAVRLRLKGQGLSELLKHRQKRGRPPGVGGRDPVMKQPLSNDEVRKLRRMVGLPEELPTAGDTV